MMPAQPWAARHARLLCHSILTAESSYPRAGMTRVVHQLWAGAAQVLYEPKEADRRPSNAAIPILVKES